MNNVDDTVANCLTVGVFKHFNVSRTALDRRRFGKVFGRHIVLVEWSGMKLRIADGTKEGTKSSNCFDPISHTHVLCLTGAKGYFATQVACLDVNGGTMATFGNDDTSLSIAVGL